MTSGYVRWDKGTEHTTGASAELPMSVCPELVRHRCAENGLISSQTLIRLTYRISPTFENILFELKTGISLSKLMLIHWLINPVFSSSGISSFDCLFVCVCLHNVYFSFFSFFH